MAGSRYFDSLLEGEKKKFNELSPLLDTEYFKGAYFNCRYKSLSFPKDAEGNRWPESIPHSGEELVKFISDRYVVSKAAETEEKRIAAIQAASPIGSTQPKPDPKNKMNELAAVVQLLEVNLVIKADIDKYLKENPGNKQMWDELRQRPMPVQNLQVNAQPAKSNNAHIAEINEPDPLSRININPFRKMIDVFSGKNKKVMPSGAKNSEVTNAAPSGNRDRRSSSVDLPLPEIPKSAPPVRSKVTLDSSSEGKPLPPSQSKLDAPRNSRVTLDSSNEGKPMPILPRKLFLPGRQWRRHLYQQ